MPSAQWWIIAPLGGGGSSVPNIPNGAVVVAATTTAQQTTYNNSFTNQSSFTYQGKQYNAVAGPFATQAQAQSEASTGVSTSTAVAAGVANASPVTAPAAGAAGAATGVLGALGSSISDPLDYLADVGDFFHRLTEAAFWERCGEVLVGVIILYIGVRALTQDTAAGNAIKNTKSKIKSGIETAAVVAPK